MWDFSCPDWVDRLKDRRSLVPDLPLDQVEAARACAIFDKLRLPDVPGNPEMADAAGQWFRDIVSAVFGSLIDGQRQVPELFAAVPKKNSKTTGGAGIMLTALMMNERPRAEFLLVGPTQEVADLAFQQASGMIALDPALVARFQVRDHVKTILDRWNGSTLKVKTFDMKVMVGAKPTGVLVDELHVMSSLSYASSVIGQIRGGFDARPDGFLIFITTQSDNPPRGCFKAELQLARGIRDGRIIGEGASMLPVLYEFPEDMQRDRSWEDPDNWPMVVPNLGKSISMDRLRQQFAQACEKGEEEKRRWASQHLNVEVGLGMHSQRWRGADFWETSGEALDLETLLERSEVVTVGIDGGGLDDMFGLSVIGRCGTTGDWLGWSKAWVQRDILALRPEIAEALRDFEAQGDLVLCDDATQDIEEVVALVADIEAAGLLPEKDSIGLDPQSVGALVDALVRAGVPESRIVGVAQGFRLSSAVWTLERKLKDGTFWHSEQPLMDWCVGNAKAEQRGNAVLITKEVAGKAKIDPLIALFNAAKLMEWGPEPAKSKRSVYEDRGLVRI